MVMIKLRRMKFDWPLKSRLIPLRTTPAPAPTIVFWLFTVTTFVMFQELSDVLSMIPFVLLTGFLFLVAREKMLASKVEPAGTIRDG